jgi:hypothetical protein
MAPALPAILAFVGTAATLAVDLATQPDSPEPIPIEGGGKIVDQELKDANRKGRQIFAGGDETIVTGSPIGAGTTVTEAPLVIGT